MQNQGIKVEKSSFEFKGNTCYEYFIGANIRGRDVKIKLGPSDPLDKGGYAVLDIVFGIRSRTVRVSGRYGQDYNG